MDVEGSEPVQGRNTICPSYRTVLLGLVFYTLVICAVFYIVITPMISTQNAATQRPPTEAPSQTKPAKDDNFIFSQANPAIGKKLAVHAVGTSEVAKIAERPSVRRFYRSMKDFQPLDKTCSSCAIVSSSGQLLGKGAGKEIDSKSCVIRMNTAPAKGFEDDVGARTTLRTLCFIAVKALKNQGDEFLLGPRRPESVLFWGLNQAKHKGAKENAEQVFHKYVDSVDFYAQTLEGEDEAGELFSEETGFPRDETNTWLSTGWFTVMVALDVCREIHIYGMIPDDYCRTHQKEQTRYHYFQKNTSPTECSYYKSNEASTKGGHRFITEKAVFARWAKKFNMTFHYPQWDLSDVNISKPLDTPFSHKAEAIMRNRKNSRNHSMSVLFKVMAVFAALFSVACVLGICAYPWDICDTDDYV